MEKRRDGQVIAIVALAFAVVFMSVGFALFSQNLKIDGTAYIDKAVWDIHFDGNSFVNLGNDSTAISVDSPGTTLSWKTQLHRPGDVAEFSIEIVNKGSFDAVLKNITMDVDTEDGGKYLKYTVTYDGDSYTESTTGLNYSLPAGQAEKVKVKLEYVQPADNSLPTDDVKAHVLTTLDFEQA